MLRPRRAPTLTPLLSPPSSLPSLCLPLHPSSLLPLSPPPPLPPPPPFPPPLLPLLPPPLTSLPHSLSPLYPSAIVRAGSAARTRRPVVRQSGVRSPPPGHSPLPTASIRSTALLDEYRTIAVALRHYAASRARRWLRSSRRGSRAPAGRIVVDHHSPLAASRAVHSVGMSCGNRPGTSARSPRNVGAANLYILPPPPPPPPCPPSPTQPPRAAALPRISRARQAAGEAISSGPFGEKRKRDSRGDLQAQIADRAPPPPPPRQDAPGEVRERRDRVTPRCPCLRRSAQGG